MKCAVYIVIYLAGEWVQLDIKAIKDNDLHCEYQEARVWSDPLSPYSGLKCVYTNQFGDILNITLQDQLKAGFDGPVCTDNPSILRITK